MGSPVSSPSHSPSHDEYSSSVPEINGRVPSCPWAHRCLTDPSIPLRDSYRPSYDHNTSYDVPRGSQAGSTNAGDRSSTDADAMESHKTAPVSQRESQPASRSPAQLPNQGLTPRRREIAETTERTVETHPNSDQPAPISSENTLHVSQASEHISQRVLLDADTRMEPEHLEHLEEGEIPRYVEESSLFVPQHQDILNAHPTPRGNAATAPDSSAEILNSSGTSAPIPREVPKGCICAIKDACPHKHNALSDCRTLVQEDKIWQTKTREFEENYHSEYVSVSSPKALHYWLLTGITGLRRTMILKKKLRQA